MEKTKPKIYTLGFCFNRKKDKVVLIKKDRSDWQKGLLNGVGGGVWENENDYEAQVREFHEETGVKTINLDWQMYAIMHSPNFIIYCYYCVSDRIFKEAKTVESEKVVKIKVKNLPKYKTISNLKWLIHLALNASEDKELRVVKVEYR